MSVLIVAGPVVAILAVPGVWVAWRVELAVRARWQAMVLAKDLKDL